jgi:hypothetical protein
MRTTVARLLGASVLWLSSCGGGGGGTITKGQYCDSTGTAFCHRIEECQGSTFNACFQGFKGACCIDDGSCGVGIMNTSTFMTFEAKCTAALMTEACADAIGGVVPAVCLMTP